jgi:hypothetical protein
MADIPTPTSNQDKGADGRSCPRARWLIALFWLERATVPVEWPIAASYAGLGVKEHSEKMREVLEDIPCTVPGCGYCGRPITRGVAGNTNRDAMDQTFEMNGRQFRIVVQEQAGQHWLPANARDFTREELAEMLEEMARRVREGVK